MLDSLTMLYLAALLFLVLPLMMVFATAGQGNRAVVWWCGGSGLAGLGIVLMALRPWLPVVLSFHGGNACLLGSFVLWCQSLKVFQQRAWQARLVVAALGAGALYYSVLFAAFAPDVRGMGMRAALGALAFATAWHAWRLARSLRSRNALTISVCFVLLGAGLWGQWLLQGGGGQTPNPFGRTWDASGLAMVALTTSVMCHFCFTGLMLDTSRRRQVRAAQAQAAADETARLNVLLQQEDRQRRMLMVAGSIAHELNQPLAAALMQAQVAQRHLRTGAASPEVVEALLGRMASGLRRTTAILDRVQAAGECRVESFDCQYLDMRAVVRDSLPLLLEPVGSMGSVGLRVEVELGDEPLLCYGDEVALSQVLVNLLRNAQQAVVPGADPRLVVTARRWGDEVQVVVRDHGMGVPQEVLDHLGELLPNTRAAGSGMGIGLAISFAIVQEHQGRLSLRNHPDGGAEAVLALPFTAEPSP